MPNYGGESSGPSDLGGGNYTGGGDNKSSDGGGILGIRPLVRFSQPPAAAYTDVLGAVSDGARGRNMPYQQNSLQAPQGPQLSPLQQSARQQAQMDMGSNTWGRPYQAPQMNPMSMGNPFMGAFPWGQFFNTFGGK